MAWKSGSAAALRNRNEKERQEKTGMATAAGGAEPLSQRKSADSRNPLALGSTGTSWAKGSAAACVHKNSRKQRADRRAPTCIPRRWRITGQGTTWALRMPWTAGATS